MMQTKLKSKYNYNVIWLATYNIFPALAMQYVALQAREKISGWPKWFQKYFCCLQHENPAGIYLLKVNNTNTRTRCEYIQS